MNKTPRLSDRAGTRGPRSAYARFAYGYSDEKPGAASWIILGLMIAFVAFQGAQIDWAGRRSADAALQNGGGALDASRDATGDRRP